MTRRMDVNEGKDYECVGHCDGRSAHVWWYANFLKDGKLALCDKCAFNFTVGLLGDVLEGRGYTLGSIVDALEENVAFRNLSPPLWRLVDRRADWMVKKALAAEKGNPDG